MPDEDALPTTRPLVLIAAVRRTGSTLLSEALTSLPHAFVFTEPKLFRGRAALRADDAQRLARCASVDVAGAVGNGRVGSPVEAARHFRDNVLIPVLQRVEQVGIKEIRYGPGWRAVLAELAAVAPLRVVALGRDPRDMYLSLAHRVRVRRVPLAGEFGPEAIAADIQQEFAVQRDLISETGALAVRYEDLCMDPAVLPAIREFVGSPVAGDGAIGVFKPDEHRMHGGTVTDLSVERWRHEPEAELLADARETMARLEDYCRFWGYG